MLTQNDRNDLVWAMKNAILEQTYLTESAHIVSQFVKEEATYEQLLNLTFNPHDSSEVYLEASDLEEYAKEVILSVCCKEDLTVQGKFELLESILQEGPKWDKVKDKVKGGATVAGQKIKGAGSAAVKKTEKIGKAIQSKGKAINQPINKGAGPQGTLKGTRRAIGAGIEKIGAGIANNPKKSLAGAGVATAAALYYGYRKLRKAGKSKQEAAAQAAQTARSAGNMEAAAKWQKIAMSK